MGSVRREEFVELAGAVEGSLGSFGGLVHFVDDEAGEDGVDCETVDGHEESADGEGDDEDDLNKRTSTRRR